MIEIGNQTIAFSIPFDKAERIKNRVAAAVKQYNVYSPNSCTKGKALYYLVDLGFEEFIKRIEAKAKELKEKYGKMVEMKEIEELLNNDEVVK